ncbi:MAG: hypothetical protein KGL74_04615, partial [Elusimicrobia bacterium]|nr:hypothetical protein [Elusimicrobiota bacterium]
RKKKTGKTSAAERSAAAASDEIPDAPDPAGGAAAAPKRRRAEFVPTYTPRFKDCLHGLQACVDGGAAFGDCVGRSPACEQKSVKGCCPGACLEIYHKALNDGESEAEAYRNIFNPEATCAAPPKSDDE